MYIQKRMYNKIIKERWYKMQIGIIGLPLVGKSTVFDLLTESQHASGNKAKIITAVAKIPDARIDFLSNYYQPKKTTYAQLDVIDIPGLVPGSASYMFLDAVRQTDALLFVLKAFLADQESEPGLPLKEMTILKEELLLADLDLIEKRIERINNNKKKAQMMEELQLLEKLKKCLEDELPLSSFVFNGDEQQLIINYNLLTLKPVLLCVNITEQDIHSPDYTGRDDLLEAAAALQWKVVELSAAIEQEIAGLEGSDKQMFMEDLGISEVSIAQISRSLYELLGFISFFTVGEDEVKAWTIPQNTPARKAAGKIHSDIERGFIRAEVAAFAHFCEYGSMAALREKGLLRLEGKEYMVQDGDIVHFRFNV